MSSQGSLKQSLLNRLRRIEGQIRGIERMIEADEDCFCVLTQLCAARRALDRVGVAIITDRIEECIGDTPTKHSEPRKNLEKVLALFIKLR